jgi:hypothetical protein
MEGKRPPEIADGMIVFSADIGDARVLIRISGENAKDVAIMLFALMTKERRVERKTFNRLLSSGEPLDVIRLPRGSMTEFVRAATARDLEFYPVEDKGMIDKTVDVFIRAEDSPIIGRILEKIEVTIVAVASICGKAVPAMQKSVDLAKEIREKLVADEDIISAPRENVRDAVSRYYSEEKGRT